MSGDIEQQRRLTDTWLPREQDDSARHDSSAEYPVKLANAGREVAALDSRMFSDWLRGFVPQWNHGLDLL
jgi:hypothetical protein